MLSIIVRFGPKVAICVTLELIKEAAEDPNQGVPDIVLRIDDRQSGLLRGIRALGEPVGPSLDVAKLDALDAGHTRRLKLAPCSRAASGGTYHGPPRTSSVWPEMKLA